MPWTPPSSSSLLCHSSVWRAATGPPALLKPPPHLPRPQPLLPRSWPAFPPCSPRRMSQRPPSPATLFLMSFGHKSPMWRGLEGQQGLICIQALVYVPQPLPLPPLPPLPSPPWPPPTTPWPSLWPYPHGTSMRNPPIPPQPVDTVVSPSSRHPCPPLPLWPLPFRRHCSLGLGEWYPLGPRCLLPLPQDVCSMPAGFVESFSAATHPCRSTSAHTQARGPTSALCV